MTPHQVHCCLFLMVVNKDFTLLMKTEELTDSKKWQHTHHNSSTLHCQSDPEVRSISTSRHQLCLTHQLSYYTWTIKAKLHYASWFEAGSKLVDRFKAKFHYTTWFEPASNQLRTR